MSMKKILADVENRPPDSVCHAVEEIIKGYYDSGVSFSRMVDGSAIFNCTDVDKFIKVFVDHDTFRNEKRFYNQYKSSRLKKRIPCLEFDKIGDDLLDHIVLNNSGGVSLLDVGPEVKASAAWPLGAALGHFHKHAPLASGIYDAPESLEKTLDDAIDHPYLFAACQSALQALPEKTAVGPCVGLLRPSDVVVGPKDGGRITIPFNCKFTNLSEYHFGYQYLEAALMILSFDLKSYPSAMDQFCDGYFRGRGIDYNSNIEDSMTSAAVLFYAYSMLKMQESLLNFSDLRYNKHRLDSAFDYVKRLAQPYYSHLSEVHDSYSQTTKGQDGI